MLCACDGFNYITYDDDLENVFSKTYELLKKDGIFIFDISSFYKLANVLGNNMYGENREDIAYMWQNYFDEEENLIEMELTFLLKMNVESLKDLKKYTNRGRTLKMR